MGRLLKVEKLKQDKEIEQGFLTCKKCKVRRELYYFGRQKSRKPDGTVTFSYKVNSCKCCNSPKGELVRPHSYVIKSDIRAPKKLKGAKQHKLSPEAKEFIKRVIYMRGYIDTLEAFKLTHYHIETFGHNDRLIVDTELEMTTMFIELLNIYKREERIK